SAPPRNHEFGIRLALGAQQSSILQMIVRQGMALALTGVALGLGAAYGLTRLMTSLLFDVSATDTAVFGAVSALLALVALMACFVPAVRATKVDAMVTFRYE